MTCRKRIDGIETEENRYLGKQPGGNLPTAQVVPGMEVARAWRRLWCKTWEPVASNVAVGLGQRPGRPSKGESQAAETARGRVPRRGTGTDRLVVCAGRRMFQAGGKPARPPSKRGLKPKAGVTPRRAWLTSREEDKLELAMVYGDGEMCA